MSDAPLLDVVIINWNSGHQLSACLQAIAAGTEKGFRFGRVVVVDNASLDESSDVECDDVPLVVVRNSDNIGFGAACNQAARGSHAEYLLFMNPDVELRPDTLAVCAAFLQSREARGVGVLGVRLVDAAGHTWRSCARFPSATRMAARSAGLDQLFPKAFPPHFMLEWDHEDSRGVDQVPGAFFLVRAPVFRLLGGFDERFFLYWEDVDFALRASRAGWSSYHLSETSAFHRGGGTTDRIRPRRLSYSLRSRLQFADKHFSSPGLALVAVSTFMVEPITRAALSLAKGDTAGVMDVARAYRLLLTELWG